MRPLPQARSPFDPVKACYGIVIDRREIPVSQVNARVPLSIPVSRPRASFNCAIVTLIALGFFGGGLRCLLVHPNGVIHATGRGAVLNGAPDWVFGLICLGVAGALLPLMALAQGLLRDGAVARISASHLTIRTWRGWQVIPWGDVVEMTALKGNVTVRYRGANGALQRGLVVLNYSSVSARNFLAWAGTAQFRCRLATSLGR